MKIIKTNPLHTLCQNKCGNWCLKCTIIFNRFKTINFLGICVTKMDKSFRYISKFENDSWRESQSCENRERGSLFGKNTQYWYKDDPIQVILWLRYSYMIPLKISGAVFCCCFYFILFVEIYKIETKCEQNRMTIAALRKTNTLGTLPHFNFKTFYNAMLIKKITTVI